MYPLIRSFILSSCFLALVASPLVSSSLYAGHGGHGSGVYVGGHGGDRYGGRWHGDDWHHGNYDRNYDYGYNPGYSGYYGADFYGPMGYDDDNSYYAPYGQYYDDGLNAGVGVGGSGVYFNLR